MRTVLSGLLLFFISFTCLASENVGLKIIKSKKVQDETKFYAITLKYPETHDAHFNAIVNKTIKGITESFKKNINEVEAGPPEKPHENSLDVNYQVMYSNPNILSIRFSIYTYYFGAAHPNTTFQSINYDINNKKLLTLADLFTSDDYLYMFEKYSRKILNKKLTKQAKSPVEVDSEGIKPVVDNYKIWNVTSNGLLLTFPPYQVAAYAFGPQEVMIPFSVFKGKIKEDVVKG